MIAALVAAAVRVLIVGVIVTADGLVVRELLSTKRLPWASLRRAEVRRSDGVRLELYGPRTARVLHNPTIHYVPRGEKVPRLVTVTALGTYRLAVAEQRAEVINDLIRQHSDQA